MDRPHEHRPIGVAPTPPPGRAGGACRRAGLALVALAATLAVVTTSAGQAGAAPHAFGDPIFSADARGDITTIGNVTTTCDPNYTNAAWTKAESSAACNGSRNGATG